MKHILFLSLIFTSFLGAAELRVVSLSPALTELVCHLGKEKLLVGRSDVCNVPSSVKSLPVAGRFAIPYVEKVIALKPDLLISNDFVNPGVKAVFERAGIRTLQLPCRTMAEYRRCVEITGRELNAAEAAAKELKRIDAFLVSEKKKLGLCVLWVVWDMPLMTPGRRSHLNEIIELTGAVNATGEFDMEYLRPSFDKLLKKKIDVIIWSASSSGWKQRRVWRKFSAVRQNRVCHGFDQDALLRPGPRLPEAVKQLRKMLEETVKE